MGVVASCNASICADEFHSWSIFVSYATHTCIIISWDPLDEDLSTQKTYIYIYMTWSLVRFRSRLEGFEEPLSGFLVCFFFTSLNQVKGGFDISTLLPKFGGLAFVLGFSSTTCFEMCFPTLPAASHGNLPKDHQGLRKFLDDIMAISKSTSFLRS